jgi:hypothetical protein
MVEAAHPRSGGMLISCQGRYPQTYPKNVPDSTELSWRTLDDKEADVFQFLWFSGHCWTSLDVTMAEEVGFEPTVPFPVRRFSRPLP